MTDQPTTTPDKHSYETVAGSEPDALQQHKPRTIEHTVTHPDGSTELHLMSEYRDGVFIQWSTCSRCGKHVTHCTDPDGPVEPKHLPQWRAGFPRSFDGRPNIDYALVPQVVTELRARGFVIGEQAPAPDLTGVLPAAQAAQDASLGDSNDTEIELLRDALETALGALGLTLPEPREPEEEEPTPSLEDLAVPGLTEKEADDFVAAVSGEEGTPGLVEGTPEHEAAYGEPEPEDEPTTVEPGQPATTTETGGSAGRTLDDISVDF